MPAGTIDIRSIGDCLVVSLPSATIDARDSSGIAATVAKALERSAAQYVAIGCGEIDRAAVAAMCRRAKECSLDLLIGREDGFNDTYYGVFDGPKMFTKMRLAGDLHAGIERALYRSDFLIELGIRPLSGITHPTMTLFLEALIAAKRVSCASAASLGMEPYGVSSAFASDAELFSSFEETLAEGCSLFAIADALKSFADEKAMLAGAIFQNNLDSLLDELLLEAHARISSASKRKLTAQASGLPSDIAARLIASASLLPKSAIKQMTKEREKLAKTRRSTMRAARSKAAALRTFTRRTTDPGVTVEKRPVQVVASLTSFPARIDSIYPAIESIMAQTVKADRIVLWLALEQFPRKEADLPRRLLDIRGRGLEIRWCERDIMPYKRSVCCMQEFPESIVIAFDDDLLFPDDTISHLLESYEKHPRAISAMRTHTMLFKEDGSIESYRDWGFEDSSYVDEERMDLFATMGAGTLFPPGLLPSEALDVDCLMELASGGDDLWFKVMELIADVPVVLAREYRKLASVPGTQEVFSLWSDNRLSSGNDATLAKLLDRFGWDLLDKCRDAAR
ncbi:MAG: hypothetical protein K6G78_01705 [bacterium]|nr:hypothetical protein [bacterium]